jgi:ubiquinone/menaquinone biosynthesis C-methylase UbiE
MAGSKKFWEVWAPYLSYVEDNYLDRESIKKLIPFITSPVLIVGAGQGLLVEELQKQGLEVTGVDYEPLMVEYAKKRRGLKLIQSDAADMPFDDHSFKSSVIATGVVDFMNDDEQVKKIINETQRVTDKSGDIFVAFYHFPPRVEQLLRYCGLLTDQDIWRYKRSLEMMTLSTPAYLQAVKKEANVGLWSAFLTHLKIYLRLPAKEKRPPKSWTRAWKQAKQDLGSIETILAGMHETIPYRNQERLDSLFKSFAIPIQKMFDYGSCIVVQV